MLCESDAIDKEMIDECFKDKKNVDNYFGLTLSIQFEVVNKKPFALASTQVRCL